MNRIIKYYVLLFFLMGSIKVIAQLSPGELSKSHAQLEGLKNCTKCHVLGEKETTSKCLECHTEIQTLISQNKGYHASSEVNGKNCAECHGEHFGRDFNITRFESKNFDHSLSGYVLEGKHAKLDCADCHKPKVIINKISQKKGETYLGLGTQCLSCHTDYHRGTLSNTCNDCHNMDAFQPAPGFDHAQTTFPLVGRHRSLECKECHEISQINNVRFQKFSGIEDSNCTSCHVDVHNNKFGNNCTRCHNEFSFTQIKSLNAFNHEQTDFPLRGLHQALDCNACHKTNLTGAIKHNLCSDCHSDYHNGEFAKNDNSPDCAICHTVSGFTPSNFTIERHKQTNFPLDGAHLATACVACHKQNERWSFADRGSRCVNCHENIHKNYIREKYYPEEDCRNCHTTNRWSEIRFDHSLTSFTLEGKHREVSCRSCHFPKQNNAREQQFEKLSLRCEACHTDVHFKQFEVTRATDCSRCHTPNNWLAEKFDHNNARFKLDGKHIGLKCVKCHKPTKNPAQNYIIYKFKDITCTSCH